MPRQVRLLCLLWVLLSAPAMAQDAIESTTDEAEINRESFSDATRPLDSTRHVSILVGLPGDRPHQEQFDTLIGQWSEWLVTALSVPPENLTVLSATRLTSVAEPLSANAKTVTEHLQQLAASLDEEDSLWILFLGHANYDGERAFFHLPGPDLSADEYGKLLEPLRCREQVVWLTMGSSGWFLKPLSRQGRLIVAATLTDAEPNETEFPHALSDSMLSAPAALDTNQDQQVSMMEFLSSVVTHIKERYENDERAPTEHAQLDDDGNGRGTEIEKLLKIDASIEETPGTPKLDGQLAGQMMLPLKIVQPSTPRGHEGDSHDQNPDARVTSEETELERKASH